MRATANLVRIMKSGPKKDGDLRCQTTARSSWPIGGKGWKLPRVLAMGPQQKTKHNQCLAIKRTFEELLASILLEECFVDGRARQIVNHEVDNRLNLILRVACIIRNSRVLLPTLLATLNVHSVKVAGPSLTHSPRSSISRARYMEAAATWLGR